MHQRLHASQEPNWLHKRTANRWNSFYSPQASNTSSSAFSAQSAALPQTQPGSSYNMFTSTIQEQAGFSVATVVADCRMWLVLSATQSKNTDTMHCSAAIASTDLPAISASFYINWWSIRPCLGVSFPVAALQLLLNHHHHQSSSILCNVRCRVVLMNFPPPPSTSFPIISAPTLLPILPKCMTALAYFVTLSLSQQQRFSFTRPSFIHISPQS